LIVVASSAVPPIGARLRAERRRRDISVRGLAREIGVSASLISQIETEKSSPSVSTLYAITTALGISIETLFGDPPTPDLTDDGSDEPAEDGAPHEAASDPANGALASVGDPVMGAFGSGGMSGGVGAALLTALTAAGSATAMPGDPLPAAAGSAAGSARGASGVELAAGPDKRLGPVVTPDLREVLTLDSGVTWELLGRIPHKHVDFLLITYQPGGTSSSSGLLMRHSGTEFGFVVSGELTLTLGFDTHRLQAGDAVSFDSSTPHAYRNETTEPAVGVWFVLERSA
jgi:transcriptional regulator with XRE-family HTH domain/quercetin dioxygenase-like cupin family protein